MCRKGGRIALKNRRAHPLIAIVKDIAADRYSHYLAQQRQLAEGPGPIAKAFDRVDISRGDQYQSTGKVAGRPTRPLSEQQRADSQSREARSREPALAAVHTDNHQHLHSSNNENMESSGAAPPSYEESVGDQSRGLAPSPPRADIKRRPIASPHREEVDNGSDISSLSETEAGVLTPTTEMEAQQDRQQQDLLARATQNLFLQDGKRQAPPQEVADQSRGPSQGNNLGAARISSIAQWLSQHESSSETSARGIAPPEGPPPSHLPAHQTLPPVQHDSFEEHWQRHPEHRPEALGMSRLETKLAIKAAYKAEKQTIRANYRAEKQAVKEQRRQFKKELKELKHGLR